MTLRLRTLTRDEHLSFIKSRPNASFLQTPAWGDVKAEWRSESIGWIDESGYIVLECFPTSAWRSSGLVPLAAKSKNPDLAPYWRALRRAYALPRCRIASHDDLQAIVASLSAAAAAGGPASALPRGTRATFSRNGDGSSVLLEGYIWDVKPRIIRATRPA